MRGRLNLMQRMMLCWRELHPYSAIHVVTLDGNLDAARLEHAIAAQLAAWGLNGLELDAAGRRFEYRGGDVPVALALIAAGPDPDAALDAEIGRQLNTPFGPPPDLSPYRFFAQPRSAFFRFGVTYDHFIAGGDVVAGLLAAIAARYAGIADTSAPPLLYPPTYRWLFARHPLLLLRTLAQLPLLFGRAKRAYRPPHADDSDGTNDYAQIRLAPAEAVSIRATARSLGVTLNDFLIVALLRAAAPSTTERLTAVKRRELAVASIVNVRREFGAPAQHAFGQFLAVLRVTHPVPPDIGVAALARDVHAMTDAIKRDRSYLRALFAAALALLIWPLLAVRHRQGFLSKHSPAVAGISLLGVTAPWRERGIAPRDYLRAVSTGPGTPLVLAVSVTDDSLSLGVTWRRSVYTPAIVSALADRLREGMQPCAA